MRLVRFVDSASAGKKYVMLVLNEQNEVWNFSTESFGSRAAESEFDLTEQTPDFPCEHIAWVDIPDSAGDLTFRIEEKGDASRIPLVEGGLPTLEGHITNFVDILDVPVPGSGVDGQPDITLGRLQLELLSFGKGWWEIDKATQTLRLHLIGSNQVIRELRVVDNAELAALIPPDAT